MSNSTADWSLYPYDPVKPLPIVFAVLVFIIALFHVYQTFIAYKWPRFGGTMIFASSVWIAGFICRAISVYNVQSIDVFISQYVLILAGPPLYAAAETFILGRLLAYMPYHAFIHPGRVMSTFIILSSVVEALTASGASNSASGAANNDPSLRSTGLALLKAGLIMQGVIEIGFSTIVLSLYAKCKKSGHLRHNVKTMCLVILTTSIMMLVRCIIRAIEGFEGAACAAGDSDCGPVDTHEWFLWVFEVANVTIFITALAVFTPGKYLPRDDKQYLDPIDGVTERVGPGFSKADKRPFLVTVLDPFNFSAILCGKGMEVDKFWERENPIAEFNFAQGGIYVNSKDFKQADSA